MLESFYDDIENLINKWSTTPLQTIECHLSEVKPFENTNTPKNIFTMPVDNPTACNSFEISKDVSYITIGAKSYEIPSWYNKKMVEARDIKTLQMIFIHHGLDYTKYINASE